MTTFLLSIIFFAWCYFVISSTYKNKKRYDRLRQEKDLFLRNKKVKALRKRQRLKRTIVFFIFILSSIAIFWYTSWRFL